MSFEEDRVYKPMGFQEVIHQLLKMGYKIDDENFIQIFENINTIRSIVKDLLEFSRELDQEERDYNYDLMFGILNHSTLNSLEFFDVIRDKKDGETPIILEYNSPLFYIKNKCFYTPVSNKNFGDSKEFSGFIQSLNNKFEIYKYLELETMDSEKLIMKYFPINRSAVITAGKHVDIKATVISDHPFAHPGDPLPDGDITRNKIYGVFEKDVIPIRGFELGLEIFNEV